MLLIGRELLVENGRPASAPCRQKARRAELAEASEDNRLADSTRLPAKFNIAYQAPISATNPSIRKVQVVALSFGPLKPLGYALLVGEPSGWQTTFCEMRLASQPGVAQKATALCRASAWGRLAYISFLIPQPGVFTLGPSLT